MRLHGKMTGKRCLACPPFLRCQCDYTHIPSDLLFGSSPNGTSAAKFVLTGYETLEVIGRRLSVSTSAVKLPEFRPVE
jgi:hypothetical protein